MFTLSCDVSITVTSKWCMEASISDDRVRKEFDGLSVKLKTVVQVGYRDEHRYEWTNSWKSWEASRKGAQTKRMLRELNSKRLS